MATVMVVDDSSFLRAHLVKLLGTKGYDTITASDGFEAVSAYRRDKPDLVLMDITMPGKNGLEALLEIRNFDHYAKVIMLTALNQELTATRAIHIGAMDFLSKPVAPNRLLTAVERALAYK